MAISTSISVNGGSGAATLDILVDGQVQTTYSYADNAFTMSERPSDVTVSKDDVAAILDNIDAWMLAVHKHCTVVYDAFEPHDFSVDDRSNRVVIKLKFGPDLAIHAIVQKASPDVELKARPALLLSPCQFDRFRKVLSAINAPYTPYALALAPE